jgi:hypothetical protein
MRKIISVIQIILLTGCMTADPKISNYDVSKNRFDWDYDHLLFIENNSFVISLFPSKNSDRIFDFITNRYIIDSERSAKKFLSDNYDIYLIGITNKTNAEKCFYLRNLHLKYKAEYHHPISPVDLPSEINRINPKGISKNIYNALVIITVTIAVIAIIAYASKGNIGSLPGGPNFDFPAGPKKWSAIYHGTKYKFDDLIIDENILAPNESKSGILFMPKRKINFDNNLKMIYY